MLTASTVGNGVAVALAWLNVQVAKLADALARKQQPPWQRATNNTFDHFETFVTGQPAERSQEFEAQRFYRQRLVRFYASVAAW